MSPASYQTAPPRDVCRRMPAIPATANCYQSDPSRAGNGTRTRDPDLGKVVLYQLSYSRETVGKLPEHAERRNHCSDGGEGDRTPDLVNAIHALSQLSYAPATMSRPRTAPDKHGNVARATMGVNEDSWPQTGPNRAQPKGTSPR